MTNTVPTEHEEQVQIFRWADLYSTEFPALKMLYAIPNGSYKSKQSARKFAAEGLKSGVPDICLPVPSADGKYHALYIISIRAPIGAIIYQLYHNQCR